MTTLSIVLIVLLVFVLVGGWAYQTANRLDRLNVRMDLARQSLEAALDRRAVVARAIATDMATSGDETVRAAAGQLAAVADQAEHAPAAQREQAENTVSAALARTDTQSRPSGLVTELADAETRIMLARRFYNDAVRDTRNLAERRLVRWLRLGGTAQLPRYFEIIERGAPPGNQPE